MLLVGLTGGIASGKTLVSDAFKTHGALIIDADLLARDVVKPGTPGLSALQQHYGPTILLTTGELDRAALRRIIFDAPEEREFVDSVLHPLIRELADAHIRAADDDGQAYLIYAVPLLVETEQQSRFDRVLVVDVPQALQIQRLMVRDGCTETDAQKILSSQATREARLAIADDVIVNDGNPEAIVPQVDALHRHYLRMSRSDA